MSEHILEIIIFLLALGVLIYICRKNDKQRRQNERKNK
jgi:cbb3-type cytochrome oxidase subunit 3